MARVFWSPDRQWRIETSRRHGHETFRLYRHGTWWRECQSVAELERVLAEEAGLKLADLIED